MKLSLWSRKLTEILYNLVEDYNSSSREYEFVYKDISLANLRWVITEYASILKKVPSLLHITNSNIPYAHFSEEIPDLKIKKLVIYLTERCLVMEKMLEFKSSINELYIESENYISSMDKNLSRKTATSPVVYPFNPKGYLHQNIALKYIYRNFVQPKGDWQWGSFKETPTKKILRDVVFNEYEACGLFLNTGDFKDDYAWLELYKFVYVMKEVAKQYSKCTNDSKEVA